MCNDCIKKGHTCCPIDGAEHCKHYYRPGGGKKLAPDPNLHPDVTTSNSQTPKVKLLAAVAAPVDDITDHSSQLDHDPSADDNVTFAVSGNKNDNDSYYVGVDCYPETFSQSRQATALLTSDPITLHELQAKFQAVLDSACTYHLSLLFWTYRTDDVVDVGTANSGYLHTEAKGLVKLEVELEGDPHR